MERFLKLRLPHFTSRPNPDEVAHWLKEIEKTFVTLDYAATEKTPLATFILKDDAYDWWITLKRMTYANKNLMEIP